MWGALSRPVRGPVVRVFLLAFVVSAYFMPRWADWNSDSRLDLVHAIVSRHTLTIDQFHWNTWDKAVYKGHYYSDKAPGTAFLGTIVYAAFSLARSAPGLGSGISALEQNSAWNEAVAVGKQDTQKAPAPRGTNLGGCQRAGTAGNVQYIPWGNRLYPPFSQWALSNYVITAGTVGLLSAVFIAFFFWFLGFFTRRRAYRWLLTGLLALATVCLPYSTVFYSHELVAGMLFAAFALLYVLSIGRVGSWAAPAAGLLLGLSLLTEYTVVLIVFVLALYALWVLRAGPKRIISMAVAGAIPVAGLMAYNYVCFGSAFDSGYSHDFCWSSAQAAGYAGFTFPQLGPLWDLTFGAYRGIFYLSPFLLLAVPGVAIMARRRLGVEGAVCMVIAVGFIVAITAYWGWNGGRVDGPRYLVPIVPFLAFPVLFFLEQLGRRIAALALLSLAASWSLFAVWSLFLGGDLYPISWLRNPLIDYSLPQLAGNHIAPNAGFFLGLRGWISLLPLVILVGLIAAVPGRRLREATRRPAMLPAATGQ